MQLTLSSDPRVWMGGGIPTRWLWYGREGRENRDGRRVSKSILIILANFTKVIIIVRNTIAIWATGGGQKCLYCKKHNSHLGHRGCPKVLILAYLQHCAELGRVRQ